MSHHLFAREDEHSQGDLGPVLVTRQFIAKGFEPSYDVSGLIVFQRREYERIESRPLKCVGCLSGFADSVDFWCFRESFQIEVVQHLANILIK